MVDSGSEVDRIPVPGLKTPFRVYFFADTHLQEHDPADPRISSEWRKRPRPALPKSGTDLLVDHLDRAMDLGADLVIHGGDLFHFPTLENVRAARTAFAVRTPPRWTIPGTPRRTDIPVCLPLRTTPVTPRRTDIPVCLPLRAIPVTPRRTDIPVCLPLWTVPGNHDWFFPGQDGWEALRDRQLPDLREVLPPTPWIRDFHGVRFVGIDNSTYFPSQVEADTLIRELDRGGPVVAIMHIPLSTPDLRVPVIEKHGAPILMADPQGRTRSGVDPEPARRVAHALRTSPRLLAVLAAHVHLPFATEIAPGVPQLVPDAGYRGGFRIVEFGVSDGPRAESG